jgi:YesN/AraC family two-component response regulator
MLKQFADLIITDNPDEITPSKENIISGYILAMYCEKGVIQFSINNQQFQAGEGDLILCSPRNLVGLYMRSPDLQSKIICASEQLFDDVLTSVLHLDSNWWQKFNFIIQNPVVHLSEYQNKLFQAYFNLMTTYMEDDDNLYRQRIIKLTAQSLAVEVLHEVSGLMPEDMLPADATVAENSRKDQLFKQFVTLLGRPDNTNRSVQAFAEQLKVTPKYLSAICKAKSGRTAMDLITEATVRNIRYYLSQTELSVKEIAFKLRFPDVSFFCKYTKKHLGKSPLEFRSESYISS